MKATVTQLWSVTDFFFSQNKIHLLGLFFLVPTSQPDYRYISYISCSAIVEQRNQTEHRAETRSLWWAHQRAASQGQTVSTSLRVLITSTTVWLSDVTGHGRITLGLKPFTDSSLFNQLENNCQLIWQQVSYIISVIGVTYETNKISNKISYRPGS